MTTKCSRQHARLPHVTGRATIERPPRAPRKDEVSLIRKVATRDHCAFGILYHRYMPRLMAFLKRYLDSTALCEEVCHEVLLIVWEQAAHFNATSHVATWIFGIAHRKALQARAHMAKLRLDATLVSRTRRAEDNPEERLQQQAQARVVAQALARLPPEQCRALNLAYYQDCSYPEIAARTGYSVSTVRSQVRQGRRRLSSLLTEQQQRQCDADHKNTLSGSVT